MSRRAPLLRHNVLLPEGMWAELEEFYPNNSRSQVIRTIVETHLKRLRAARYGAAVTVTLEEPSE